MTDPPYVSAESTAVRHPHDDGVVLATYSARDHGCDAIVSLCRIGTDDFAPSGVDPQNHVVARLVNREDPDENPYLDFVLADAARTVKALRDEGKQVFVHCVAAQARTPAVAVAYSKLLGVSSSQATADISRALPRLRGSGILWRSVESST